MSTAMALARAVNDTSTGEGIMDNQVILGLAFALLIIGGNIGFPIVMFFTAYFHGISRHLTFLNFCLSWVFSSSSFCILLYLGQVTGPQPEFAACLLQAAVTFVAPLLATLTGCALVFQLWLSFRMAGNDGSAYNISRRCKLLLVFVPHLICIPILIALLVFGSNNPKKVIRPSQLFFCTIQDRTLLKAFFSVLTVPQAIVVIFEGLIAFMIYRRWSTFRKGNIQGIPALAFFIRLILMSVAGFVFIGTSSIAMQRKDSGQAIACLVQSSVPLLTFLAFGTRLDLYKRPREFTSTSEKDPEQDATQGSAPIPDTIRTPLLAATHGYTYSAWGHRARPSNGSVENTLSDSVSRSSGDYVQRSLGEPEVLQQEQLQAELQHQSWHLPQPSYPYDHQIVAPSNEGREHEENYKPSIVTVQKVRKATAHSKSISSVSGTGSDSQRVRSDSISLPPLGSDSDSDGNTTPRPRSKQLPSLPETMSRNASLRTNESASFEGVSRF